MDADGVVVEIGFQGQAKLGCWVPFTVTTPDSMDPKTFELEVLDGDDSPVIYSGTLRPVGNELNRNQGWVKLGRTYGGGRLRLLDVRGNLVVEKQLAISGADAVCQLHKSTRRMLLTIEPDGMMAKAIESKSLLVQGGSSEIVIPINETGQLPADWFGYQGVDTVFIVTSDLAQIQGITHRQWTALEAWIENGGRLIVSAAMNADALMAQESGPLAKFCPGSFVGLGEMESSDRLESFANNGQLITRGSESIPISRFDEVVGLVLVEQNDQPLIIRQSRGFGEIVMVAFDLDSERISQWPGFGNLVRRLTLKSRDQPTAQSPGSETMGSSVSHYGYEDLVGQLRVPLDRFSKVSFISFSSIAVLIGLYVLLIGPGDYFFLRKFTGKMELTWITFPLLSLLFCGLAYWVVQWTRPTELQINQLEIVDIDATSGLVRGTHWSNLYSPRSDSYDVALDQTSGLGFELSSNVISWQGLPGDGLGGMWAKEKPGARQSSYRQLIESREVPTEYTSSLENLPLHVSSTRPLFAQWNANFPTKIRSRLVFSKDGSRVEGTITNPLDVPIRNVHLLFEPYIYSLQKEQLEPDETFDIWSETRERSVRSWLNRRTKKSEKDNRSNNSPWDPRDTRITRIADMLMFHEAAGASNYTGLTHGYQGFVDMSDQLGLKRAVLVGQIDPIATKLKIDGEVATGKYDRADTLVRIVFPVIYEEKTGR